MVDVNGLPTDVTAALTRLVEDRVASRLMAADPTLWGPEAETEASQRLAWVMLHETSRPLLPQLNDLRSRVAARGLNRVVLCGMGGSSLAPELMCRTSDVPLVVLDSSHPDMVRAAMTELETTVVVVSSKSGTTIETQSQLHAFWHAFEAAGLTPARHVVIVTDPGSALEDFARDTGCELVLADPHVGGRYSALSAFGLVPSVLAGVDVVGILDDAAEMAALLAEDDATNPGLILGAFMGVAPTTGRDVMSVRQETLEGIGDWIEQLVAESTGKDHRGVLPVPLSMAAPQPNYSSFDVMIGANALPLEPWSIAVDRPLGAQLLLWEFATAIAGRVLGIHPFDQPDVERAKAAARALLADDTSPSPNSTTDGPLTFSGSEQSTLDEALIELVASVPEGGYLALQFFLDRWRYAGTESIAAGLSERLALPVTFGWGPRYLHSTGQFHKGGPPVGAFLTVTAEVDNDLAIPHSKVTFGRLITSQAQGDAGVLRDLGRPVLAVHLTDTEAGMTRLLAALRNLEEAT